MRMPDLAVSTELHHSALVEAGRDVGKQLHVVYLSTMDASRVVA